MELLGLHVTETDRALSIEAGGFDLDPTRLGYGRLWGNGIYLAATLDGLDFYAASIDDPALLRCTATVTNPLTVHAGDLSAPGMSATYETLFGLLGPHVRAAVAAADDESPLSDAIKAAGHDALILDRSHLGDVNDTEYVIFDPTKVAVTALEDTETLMRALDATRD